MQIIDYKGTRQQPYTGFPVVKGRNAGRLGKHAATKLHRSIGSSKVGAPRFVRMIISARASDEMTRIQRRILSPFFVPVPFAIQLFSSPIPHPQHNLHSPCRKLTVSMATQRRAKLERCICSDTTSSVVVSFVDVQGP